MIEFIYNNKNISTDMPPNQMVLDFLRSHLKSIGTKEGCHKGDCGACLILMGASDNGAVRYRSVNACLTSLAEVDGKHIVTIEGLNGGDGQTFTPIQQAIVEEGATQCGYCTPGIVLALTEFFLNNPEFDEIKAIKSISGNICRCTGYQSIKRAIRRLGSLFSRPDSNAGSAHVDWLITQGILPGYFSQISNRLRKIAPLSDLPPLKISPARMLVGGGTDIWVKYQDDSDCADFIDLSGRKELKGLALKNGRCHIGAATTVQALEDSPVMQAIFPKIREVCRLIASKPIRYKATVGGNMVNASPSGDLAVFFLALDSVITLNNGQNRRELPLKDFFIEYKKVAAKAEEFVETLSFPVPAQEDLLNFEKVSKRTHLDIASVNTAIRMTMKDGVIGQIHLSAGGVAPVPLYLSATVRYLSGKQPGIDSVREAASIARSEISPIGDIRGSADYKRLLLRQLIYAHFITLFPGRITLEALR